MRTLIVLALCAVLAGCGGSPRKAGYGATTAAPVTRVASGPISQACLAAGRKAANRQLCGCVQFVADISLNKADQKTAAGFFADPPRAQEIRQSDNPRHEAFWKRYKAFGAKSSEMCRGY